MAQVRQNPPYFSSTVFTDSKGSLSPLRDAVTDTIIANEINGGCQLKLTTSRKTVTHALPSATFVFDFSDVLLLPTIEEVMYSFTASDHNSLWVAHSAMKQGKSITVLFKEPVVGSVTVEVAQAVNGLQAHPDR
jgi:hypothetical protein